VRSVCELAVGYAVESSMSHFFGNTLCYLSSDQANIPLLINCYVSLCLVFSLKIAAGAVVVSECELHGDISIGKCVKL